MDFHFSSIGHIVCDQNFKYEAPRQGVFANNAGYIQLLKNQNFEQALDELIGFDRIWVIYAFHLNKNWKPKVSPPIVADKKKIGVFATRSPHRPNSIGISSVNLERVDGLKVYIRNFDMLNQTPVLDIKPYIAISDSFPNASMGWLPNIDEQESWTLEVAKFAKDKLEWVASESKLDIINFCKVQLSQNPFDTTKKRITALGENSYSLGYRTWTIFYVADIDHKIISLEGIISNYSDSDLSAGTLDKYGDKDLHRKFKRLFENSNDC